MSVEKSKAMCAGCYCNDYNHGLGGAKECWNFGKAKVKLRKAVHINQVPPWKQKPAPMLDCYHKSQWVFVDGDIEC